MSEEIEIYPKSSPFESFLARAINDLWTLSMSNKPLYIEQVRRLVRVFIPTIFSSKIKFDLEKEVAETDAQIAKIERDIQNSDPFIQDNARTVDEVNEMVELADHLFHATLDALFEQKLLIPMRITEGRPVG